MSSYRRTALITGVFFIVTFIASIAALVLYSPVLNDTNYIVSAGHDARVELGAFCEVILIIANIGTAVTLFPVLKRQNESAALGFVASRLVESIIIAAGVISLLSVATLRRDYAGTSGANAGSLVVAGRALVTFHNWTFLLGPGFTVGVGNGLLLGYLMYRSGLMPRATAMLGLIGGPLIIISGTAVIFGLYKQISAPSGIATIPEFLWEASLGIYLTFKGFRSSPSISGRPAGVPGDVTRVTADESCRKAAMQAGSRPCAGPGRSGPEAGRRPRYALPPAAAGSRPARWC